MRKSVCCWRSRCRAKGSSGGVDLAATSNQPRQAEGSQIMSKRSVIRVGVLVLALGLVYGGFDIAGAAPGPPSGPPTQTVIVDNVPYSHVVGTLQFGAPCQTQIEGETCDPTAGPSVNVYGW